MCALIQSDKKLLRNIWAYSYLEPFTSLETPALEFISSNQSGAEEIWSDILQMNWRASA